MAKTFNPYYLVAVVALLKLLAIGVTLATEDNKPFQCDDLNLEQLIDRQGKWKSYEFVLGNCLVNKFIAQCGPRIGNGNNNVDIYSSLKELEEVVGENLELEGVKLERAKEEANRLISANKIKHDLEVSSAARRSKRQRLILQKLLEEARIRVSLVSNQVSLALEERLRSNVGASQKDICSPEGLPVDPVAQVRQLSRQLDAQLALQQLARKLYQRQVAAARAGAELEQPAEAA